MNKPKVFLGCFFFAFFFILLLLPVLNFHLDTSRVLTRDYQHIYAIPGQHGNLNFLKMAYLNEHRGDYDSLIVGSSRVNHGFSTKDLHELLGGSWYKLAYPAGVPADHLHNLRVLFQKGHVIKRVVLALDDFDIYFRPDRSNDYSYRPYPASLVEWVRWYGFYLFKWPGKTERDILTGKIKMIPTRWFESLPPSKPASPISQARLDKLLDLEPMAWFMRREPSFISKVLMDIKEIKLLCEKNHADLKIIITPRYYKSLLWRDFDALEKFKRGLVDISPFYDFEGMSMIALDHRYWTDASHFDTYVGKQVARCLSGFQEQCFGSYVTSKNIEDHLRRLREEVVLEAPRLLLMDDHVVIHPSLLELVEAFVISPKRVAAKGNQGWRVDLPAMMLKGEGKFILNVEMWPRNGVGSIEVDIGEQTYLVNAKRRILHVYSFQLDRKDLLQGGRIVFHGLKNGRKIKAINLYRLGNLPGIRNK